MEKLIAGLRHYRDNVIWEKQDLYERAVTGQKPLAVLVCCSDSRVLPETLLQADPGDVFISRNAGNVVPPPESTSGEAATIEYAVVVLGVQEIVICGHYRCGAVKAMLCGCGPHELPKVNEWLAFAGDAPRAVEHNGQLPQNEDELWDRAVEQNVLHQVENLKRHPVVAKGLADGSLRVHAWVLRFETGEVMSYDPEDQCFEPILGRREIRAVLGGKSLTNDPHTETYNGVTARMPDGTCNESNRTTIPIYATSPDGTADGNPSLENGCCSKPTPRSRAAKTGQRLSWLEILSSDIPSSIVVFMVALPLCVAIAKACSAPPEAGIITGIVGGILTGLFSGSPLQVSGPAAGLITILGAYVHDMGLATVGLIVLLAGAIQLAAAALRLGQWFRAISPAVILGMLSGIGVVVFLQQFHLMVDHAPTRSAWENLIEIPMSVYRGVASDPSLPAAHRPAAMVGLMSLIILLAWKHLVPRRLQSIPAVLVAVVAATAVTAILQLPIQKVDFTSLSSGLHPLEVSIVPSALANPAVWLAAITVAVVASAETLLCAAAVDQMHSGPRTRYNQELSAQGLGNLVTGALGGLPMTGVIVRSSANLQGGARTRWSAVFHGVWLLMFALLFPSVLRMIPIASLAAILVLTGLKLIGVSALKSLWAQSRSEAVIAVATMLVIVFEDLLAGVMLGVGLSVLKLIFSASHLRIARQDDPARDSITLVLEGAATFLRLPKLASMLDDVPAGTTLHVDARGLSFIDHSCLSLLKNWEKQHRATGGGLHIDWDDLHARFRQEKPRLMRSMAIAS